MHNFFHNRSTQGCVWNAQQTWEEALWSEAMILPDETHNTMIQELHKLLCIKAASRGMRHSWFKTMTDEGDEEDWWSTHTPLQLQRSMKSSAFPNLQQVGKLIPKLSKRMVMHNFTITTCNFLHYCWGFLVFSESIYSLQHHSQIHQIHTTHIGIWCWQKRIPLSADNSFSSVTVLVRPAACWRQSTYVNRQLPVAACCAACCQSEVPCTAVHLHSCSRWPEDNANIFFFYIYVIYITVKPVK
jgi:hypothetical protein